MRGVPLYMQWLVQMCATQCTSVQSKHCVFIPKPSCARVNIPLGPSDVRSVVATALAARICDYSKYKRERHTNVRVLMTNNILTSLIPKVQYLQKKHIGLFNTHQMFDVCFATLVPYRRRGYYPLTIRQEEQPLVGVAALVMWPNPTPSIPWPLCQHQVSSFWLNPHKIFLITSSW